MLTYAFDSFDPLGVHDKFVEAVEDLIGTDAVLTLTDCGEPVAVIIDIREYEDMLDALRTGGNPQ